MGKKIKNGNQAVRRSFEKETGHTFPQGEQWRTLSQSAQDAQLTIGHIRLTIADAKKTIALLEDKLNHQVVATASNDEAEAYLRKLTARRRTMEDMLVELPSEEQLDEDMVEFNQTGWIGDAMMQGAKDAAKAGNSKTLRETAARLLKKAAEQRRAPLADNPIYAEPEVDPNDYVACSVFWYRWLLDKLFRASRLSKRDRAGETLIWAHLNNARVFALPPETWLSVYRWADVYTSTEVAGLDWSPYTGKEPPPEETEKLVSAIDNAEVVWPERWPFEDTLFTYGHGVRMTREQLILRQGEGNTVDESGVDHGFLVGHLCAASGHAWEFVIGSNRENGNGVVFSYEVYGASDGKSKWSAKMGLNPWTIPATLDLVNSFKTFVHEHEANTYRRASDEEKTKRRNLPAPFSLPRTMPKPFYKLELRQETVEERLRENTKGKRARWVLSHRHDVRGHERVRVMRGSLPIEPKVERDLLRRGYRLYTLNAPTSEDKVWRLLAERHEKPKSKDEWMAIKISWVTHHVRGPEFAPLIPAVRTLPAGAESP